MGLGTVTAGSAPAADATHGRAINQAGEQRSARLESLRAIGCLGVVSAHVYIVTRLPGTDPFTSVQGRIGLSGSMGFFLLLALTGYLIYWPFAKRDFGSGGAIDLRSYLRNRAYRIFPLYYIALIILMVLQQGGGTLHQWWHFLLFAQSYSASTVGTVDGPMWSLVVELYFYALAPLFALGVARIAGGRRWRAALALVALAVVSMAVRHNVLYQAGDTMWRYSFPVNLIFFVPGMMLALFRTWWQEQRPAWADGWMGRAEVWLLASVPFWLISIENYKHEEVSVIASFLTLGAVALGLRSGFSLRALDWRPLALVGVASYSIYIWHLPILGEVLPHVTRAIPLLIVGGGVSILCGYLSYRVIEEPFLRLRKRWASASAPVR